MPYKAVRGMPCKCDFFGECVYCTERRLRDELSELKIREKALVERVEELTTFMDRSNTRITSLRDALFEIANYAVFDGTGWIANMKKIARQALDKDK